MIATNAMQAASVDAIIAGAVFNGPAGDEFKIMLFKNNVTVSPATVIGDLEAADFGGATPKTCGAGECTSAIDPVTGERQIRVLEPAGGFEFTVDSSDNLPQTIHGFAMTNEAGTELIAAENFTTPIPLAEIGHVVDVPQPKLSLPANVFS